MRLSFKNYIADPSLTSINYTIRRQEVGQVGSHSNGANYTQHKVFRIRKIAP